MTEQLEHLVNVTDLEEALASIRNREDDNALGQTVALAKLGGGVLKFAQAIFPGVELDQIYAEQLMREPAGRGPHFDLYRDYISPVNPWVGVYNVAGKAAVRTTVLDVDLAAHYHKNFPALDQAAYEVRYPYAMIAFSAPTAHIFEGSIEPGVGMVLPQTSNGLEVAHEVTPTDMTPGRYIKLAVPADQAAAVAFQEMGMQVLDELLTHAAEANEATKVDGFRYRIPGKIINQLDARPTQRPRQPTTRSERDRRSLGGGRRLD